MKTYPSIDGRINRDVDVYAFDKLDGSNIRAEFSKKQGFYKFGTRNRMMDANDIHLGEAVTLFNNKYAESLSKIFLDNDWDRGVVCFFEYFGPNSFAGQHVEEKHDVVLIDVMPQRQGMIPPNEFLKLFKNLHLPNVLYHGKANATFEDSVRSGKLEGMSFEGVVCKAANPNRKITSQPIMFKIKNQAWIDKVKSMYSGKEAEQLL